MSTKIFCDIADYKTIKFFNNKSLVDGFTTNPSLMRLAGAKNYKEYSLKILKVWEGGLASHGGFLGVMIAVGIFNVKVKKINLIE